MSDDDMIRVSIDGRTYTLDENDLELGEIEMLEDELDAPIEQIDFNRAKAMRVLVYLVIHRENPDFTMDDAKAVKVSALVPPTEEPEPDGVTAPKRPTKAAAKKRG
jgi:hypothetical protein